MSQQINLFNPIFMKQRKIFSLLTMLQALGLIVAGALFFYGYAIYQVDQLGEQSKESTKRYRSEEVRLARLTAEFSPQQANQALQGEVRLMEKQVADQTRLVGIIKSGAVGNTTGYSEYMRAFSRQIVQGLWLTGFRITGDATHITLNGAVMSPELLPTYIQRLGKENVMQGKAFSDLQMRQPDIDASQGDRARYVEFTLHSGPDREAGK